MQSGNNSIASETSSKFNEESRLKIDILMNAFEKKGWDNQRELTQDEIRYFLNDHAKDQFDPTLLQKLFSILDVDDNNRITGEEFIKGYLQFEADLKKNNDEFNKRIITEQNNFNDLEEQCRLYKSEKLSAEGFCENAKIVVEITDVMIQKQIEGINSIIIRVNYNDEIKEKNVLINDINNNNLVVNERFEFKPTSRRDKFEFYMIKVDENNNESEIGSKRFPLDEITSQEEYIVQITIPEVEDEDQVAAYINCKIVLFWSDYEFYEEKKKKSEQKLKKLKEAANKTSYYLQKIKEIYGDLSGYKNQNNFDNSNNFQEIDNRNNLRANNYNNYDSYNGNNLNYANFNQSPSTKYEIGGQKFGLEESFDPKAPVYGKKDNEFNNNESLSFKGKNKIRFFGLCILLLGLIGSLKRPDFPNILEGIFIVLFCYIGFNKEISKFLKWFKYLLITNLILIAYDFFWLTTHYEYIWLDSYTGGHENFIGFLSVISCVGNLLLKAFVGVLLLTQYNEMKRLEEENRGNNYF